MENQKQDSRNKISAGSFDLNKWLFGGYDKDIITTIYGPAGCGKTNLCIIAAASAARHGGKVIFIDTEGGFSVERFRQVCKDSEESKRALENVLILKPTNFEDQWDAFGKLLKEIKSKTEIALIVVDGMTMLYRLLLAESKENKSKVDEINSRLARQMRMLAEIARKQGIPVLATNQVYYEFLSEEELKSGKEKNAFMVGGDIMKYWSKCIIELKNTRGKRTAVLRKHRSLPEKELDFVIVNLGIRKRGFF